MVRHSANMADGLRAGTGMVHVQASYAAFGIVAVAPRQHSREHVAYGCSICSATRFPYYPFTR